MPIDLISPSYLLEIHLTILVPLWFWGNVLFFHGAKSRELRVHRVLGD